jgi:hypothetical protein
MMIVEIIIFIVNSHFAQSFSRFENTRTTWVKKESHGSMTGACMQLCKPRDSGLGT